MPKSKQQIQYPTGLKRLRELQEMAAREELRASKLKPQEPLISHHNYGSYHNYDTSEESEEEITLEYIIMSKPKIKIVRKFFEAQAMGETDFDSASSE